MNFERCLMASTVFQELEERERNLYAAQGRNESVLQGLQRDLKYHQEKNREYEKKIRQLEQTVSEEVESRERARSSFQVLAFDFQTRTSFPFGRSLLFKFSTCSFNKGLRVETGERSERRVSRNRSSQSGDRDPQSRGAGARGEPRSHEEYERRGATDNRWGRLQKLSRCFGSCCSREGATSAASVLAVGRFGSSQTGISLIYDAINN